MQQGLVSVIVCVYNAGEYLRSSVESILTQSYRRLEIIVVDDGSTDGCLASIADMTDPRLTVLHQPNGGKPNALNAALARCNGEFYAVHDADDLSFPRRIERQVQCLQANPSLAAVFVGYNLLIDDRPIAEKFAARDSRKCRADIDRMHMPGHDPTAMYRVSMVEGFRYDESLPIVEGYDYVIRVGEVYPMEVLGECLYSYRIHLNTVTKRDPRVRQRMLRQAVRKVYERRGLPCSEADLPEVSGANIRNKHRDNDLVSHFMASTVDLRHAGRWSAAARGAARCAMLHPADPYYYKPAIYAVAPLALIDRYRAWSAK